MTERDEDLLDAICEICDQGEIFPEQEQSLKQEFKVHLGDAKERERFFLKVFIPYIQKQYWDNWGIGDIKIIKKLLGVKGKIQVNIG